MSQKDILSYLGILQEEGYLIKKSGKNSHYKIYRDGKMVTVVSASSSDVRAIKNLKAQIRRYERKQYHE